jgi:HPt (histidine-containing phosphotransfer) domain-containing protein
MSPPKSDAAVTTYGDYELITPQNTLRKAVSDRPLAPGEDPVARAEKALAGLSSEFSSWMDQECDRLDKARQAIMKSGMTSATKEQLFHAAHDIKGEAATFGFPACAATADSLCRLIEYAPDQTKIPAKLIEQHVDAVRAIVREYSRSDAVELASELNKRLREVTDEFLLHANHDRPDILNSITGPSLVPTSGG